MDEQRFDQLARSLSDILPRRRALRLLAGLVGGPLAAALAPAEVVACRGLNARCQKRRPDIGKWKRCCQGLVCQGKGTKTGTKTRCKIKDCSLFLGCGEGRGCCSGTCVDLQHDPKNCGHCGNDCGANPCLGGVCLTTCVGGLTLCNGECVDTLSDPRHCGRCNSSCSPAVCDGGRCSCRKRLEACESAGECCQAVPAPQASTLNPTVSCAAFVSNPAPIGGLICAAPPPGNVCCGGQGAVCTDDCDCCGGLRCLGEVGCGTCIASGVPCPRRCPVHGPCSLCCGGGCINSHCAAVCKTYGSVCEPPIPCCNDVPCTGGRCRFN